MGDEKKSIATKFKLGIDLHGISDKLPKFFSIVTKLLKDNGHEVHLMTGEHVGDYLKEQIQNCNVSYTHIFSIADWHKNRGTKITYDANCNPWMEAKTWDSSKAIYAKENQIDLVIDDTARYGRYFEETSFMYADIQLPGEQAEKWLKLRKEGMEKAAESKTWIQKNRNLVLENFPNVIGVFEHESKDTKEFQEIFDETYSKGIDLYSVKCEKYDNTLKGKTYHIFVTEPFSEESHKKLCVEKLIQDKDSRLWS